MKYLTAILILTLLLTVVGVEPAWAGEPTGKIGPMNPTMFKCVDRDNQELYQPDPFRKPLAFRTIKGGDEITIERLQDYLDEEADLRTLNCVSSIQFDNWGFDPTDAAEFDAYLADIERSCEKRDGRLIPITEARVEGFVYEFLPRDPANPAKSEWFGVPTRFVGVEAKGITFKIHWASDENGYYYFRNLGAGPIILNLHLPPNAHAINPDVIVFSTGLGPTSNIEYREPALTAHLGFYRGDVGPPDPLALTTPDGSLLPVTTYDELADLSQCGYNNLPPIIDNMVVELPPTVAGTDGPEMPDVGGTLPPDHSPVKTILASVVVALLPLGGLLKLYQGRRKK